MSITITHPSEPPTVGPGASITFEGDHGPVESHTITSVGQSALDEDSPTVASYIDHWTLLITAPNAPGIYLLTVTKQGDKSATKPFIVSGS